MRSAPALVRVAWVLLLLATAAVVVVPLAALVGTVWAEGRHRLVDLLADPGLTLAVAHSAELCVAATLLSVPTGVAIALALRDPRLPGRQLWRAGVLLPVLVPDYVLAYSWLRAYGPAGLTTEVVGREWEGLIGPVGVAVIVATHAVPLVYLITTVGLATRAEPATERAARTSGARPATVLATITLPLLGPAVASAAVLVFVLTLGTFAVPELVGAPAGFGTVSTRIYADLALGSDPAGFVTAVTSAVLLVALALVVVVPADMAFRGGRQSDRAFVSSAPGPPGHPVTRVLLATGLGLYLTATSGLPLLALVGAAVTKAIGVPSTPANWTLDNFTAVLTPRTGQALTRSVLLAFAAASILLALGGCTAALGRTRGGRAVSVLVSLTFVLPGSVLAVGLLIAYGRQLGNTVAIILLAYLAKLWALAHRPIAAGLDRVPGTGLAAARASGATLATGLATVVVPLLRPALVAAWGLCFLTALHEVTMSSLLYGPGSETLAVVVLNSADLGQIGVTAALAVVVTAVVVVPGGLFWVVGRHGRRG
ncbi:MAG: ABC transporter permease [Propionibacteriaceae bacterium]